MPDNFMSYNGLMHIVHPEKLHLGGNIREGDPFTFAPSVWGYLIKRFAIKSVLDLGAGMGFSSHYFFEAGLQVISVEGLKNNVENANFPSILHDFTQSSIYCKVDLVHCQEVVEHIEEQYIDNILQSMTCGKFVVMTNALPGQGGHHHVNEQPTQYWIEHLRRYNFEVLDEDTNRVRALATKENATYLANTGLVLANKFR